MGSMGTKARSYYALRIYACFVSTRQDLVVLGSCDVLAGQIASFRFEQIITGGSGPPSRRKRSG